MSLVSDALRKARRETARLRGERQVTAYSLPGSAPQPRARVLTGIVVGVVLGLVAALVVVIALKWPPNRSVSGTKADAAEPAAPTSPEIVTRAATSARAPDAPEAMPQAPRAAAPTAPSQWTGASGQQPVRNEVPTPAAPRTVPPLADLPFPTPLASAPNAPRAGDDVNPLQSTGAQERVYVLRADLGYAKLQLDFIVYKPSAPFGRINGQDIVPGSIVDGFLVEEIGRDFVRLRDPHGPLVLRVR